MARVIRGISAELLRKHERAEMRASENEAVTNIAFVTMAESGTIDEVTATEHLSVFAPWEPNVNYAVGTLRTYGEEERKLYKCVQAHKSQSDWTPDKTPALWVLAGDPAEEWPEWVQPIGAQDAYMAGDKVSHGGKHWVSDVDANVWEPGAIGTESLWRMVS